MDKNTLKDDTKANEAAALTVDPRYHAQLEAIAEGTATNEGLGGWAALHSQRSTAHVVDKSLPDPDAVNNGASLVDRVDGTENPVSLVDAMKSKQNIQHVGRQHIDTRLDGSRSQDPQTLAVEAKVGGPSTELVRGDDSSEVSRLRARLEAAGIDPDDDADETDDESEVDDEDSGPDVDTSEYTNDDTKSAEENAVLKDTFDTEKLARNTASQAEYDKAKSEAKAKSAVKLKVTTAKPKTGIKKRVS